MARTPWQPPAELDEYRLVGPLGKGGMGQVYLAHDVFLDRTVAIKFLLGLDTSPTALDRFRIEARAIARLQHPNVVVVHRIGAAAGYPYIVSEHIRGQSLAELAKPVSWQRALDIGIGLARGLAAAHVRGVLHRDIKPANAMLDDEGGVKLLDFGLAKLAGALELAAAASGRSSSPTPSPSSQPKIANDAAFDQTIDPVSAPPVAPPAASERALGETMAATGDAVAPAVTLAAAPELRHVASSAPSPPRPAESPPSSSNALAGEVSALTHAGALLGTPLYMSPEAWRADALTAASDVYSLGVVLFELCAGRPPHKGTNVAQLSVTVNLKDAPPLRDHAPDVDADLAAVIDKCLARDPLHRFPTASDLRDALEAVAHAGRERTIPEGNPYRGLHAFEAEHRALFFGRDHAIREVVERLRGEALVIVAGDSGAGKSSLVRAGVIPAILDEGLGDARRWRVARSLPSAHPLQSLVASIASALKLDEADLLATTRADPSVLARTIRKTCGEATGLVILVDQLEELVTVSDAAEADATTHAIRQLAIVTPAIRVIATVRGDFLTRVAAKFGRPEEVVRAVHLLLPPDRDELRSAIVGPARLKDVAFESDALVDELVEAGARAEGGLPLLQFALAQLWNARTDDDPTIRHATLAAIGGVEGALARHADEVIAKLLPAQRAAARQVLLRLVTAEGTRARRTETELLATTPEARAALEALVRGRLLVARESDEGTSYEVAHEALIRGWQALRDWHDQSRDARVIAERLERAARDWERAGRPLDGLWSDRQLSELSRLEAPLGERDAAFVATSRAALRRRLRVRIGILASVFAVLAVAVVVLIYLRGTAERERDRAEGLTKQAREQYLEQLMEQARQALVDGNSLRAGEHLVAAYDGGYRDKNFSLLLARAAAPLKQQRAVRAVGGAVRSAQLDPAGHRVLVIRIGDPVISVFDTRLENEQRFDLGVGAIVPGFVRFAPTGARIATAGVRPAIIDLATGNRIEMSNAGQEIVEVGWSRDGSLVAGTSIDTVHIWDAATGTSKHRWSSETSTFAVGARTLVAATHDGSLLRWNLVTGAATPAQRAHSQTVRRLAIIDDDRTIISASDDGTARIWRPDVETIVLQHDGAVRDFATADNHIVTVSADRKARVWSRAGTLERTLEGHRANFTTTSFDSPGRRVVTTGADGRACIHDVTTGALQTCLDGHRSTINAAQFAPDQSQLVTGGIDGTVRIWNTDARAYAANFGLGGPAGRFLLDPSMKTLALTSLVGDVVAIDMTTATRRWLVKAHDDAPALAFSRDGSQLVTTNVDGKLWDVATGRCRHRQPRRKEITSTRHLSAMTSCSQPMLEH